MGQYWYPVNLDKKEYLYAHPLGSGLKLWEQMVTRPGTAAALIWLLHERWYGDRVAIVGDDNERDARLSEEIEEPPWKDISLEVAEILEKAIGGEFVGAPDTWREWKDTVRERRME
jgi:hypothetical protein